MKGSKDGRGGTNVISFQEAVAIRRPKSRRERVTDRVAQLLGERNSKKRAHDVITLQVSIKVPVGIVPRQR